MDNGNVIENVSPKYNLALSQVFRDYSVLFTFICTTQVNYPGTGWVRTVLKSKIENKRFIVICSRCRQNLKFGDFTLLFCEVRQKMHGN